MRQTASQIKKLGERLGHAESPSPEDLDLLDEFERSFEAAQTQVVTVIRRELGLNPTARVKSARSIIAKLRREHTALSRMQDIVGCRIVVEEITDQDDVVERLLELPWEVLKREDRRANPSHGYRAVHVIVLTMGRPVEIQVRTRRQDLWAQLSEKIADREGLDVKYGGGRPLIREALDIASRQVGRVERLRLRIDGWRPYQGVNEEFDMELEALENDVQTLDAKVVEQMHSFIAIFES